jgi:predicted small metal-binding protein
MIKCEVICRSDFGMDCDFESQDETGKEILKENTEHGRKNHGMEEI